MKIRFLSFVFLSLVLSLITYGQESIELQDNNWDTEKARLAQFETVDGVQTLLLNGRATLNHHKFSNGSIEVDIYPNQKRSFAGISFRKQDGTYEEVYLRNHKSGQVDAIQYTPVFNLESSWQLYSEHQAQVKFSSQKSNHLKIKVDGELADIFINDEKVLTIDDLRSGNKQGSIGLFSLFENRFANFKVVHIPENPKAHKRTGTSDGHGVIKKWELTEAFIFSKDSLDNIDFAKHHYKEVITETSGLLPISKFIQKPSAGNFEGNAEVYTIARLQIDSDTASEKLFSFDYSDRIYLYLNGRLLFSGNNAFRAKGLQHTGHINMNSNTLYLDLNKGKNILHCVVVDRANGWGIQAKIR